MFRLNNHYYGRLRHMSPESHHSSFKVFANTTYISCKLLLNLYNPQLFQLKPKTHLMGEGGGGEEEL